MSDDAEAHYRAGLAHSQALRWSDAEQAFLCAAAMTEDPRALVRIYGGVGYVLERQGRLMEAVALLQRACEAHPRNARLLASFAELCTGAEQFRDALRAIDDAIALSPNDSTLIEAKARILYRAGDLNGAMACCQIGQLKDSAFAWSVTGSVERKRGNYAAAVCAFRSAVDIAPTNPRLHADLGLALVDICDFEEAALTFQRAVSMSPSEPRFRVGLARAYALLGRSNEAFAAANAALDLDADLPEAHVWIANELVRQRKYPDAEEHLHRVIDTMPANVDAYVALAHARICAGKHAEAIEPLRRALDIDPESPFARLLMRLAKADPRNVDGLIEIYRDATNRFPGLAWAHYYLGRALICVGKYREAIESLDRARQMGPNVGDACFWLGDAFERDGDMAMALQCYEESIHRNGPPDSYYRVGYIRWKRGDYRTARMYWLKAAELGSGKLKRDAQAAVRCCALPGRVVNTLVRGFHRLRCRLMSVQPAASS